MQTPRHNLDAVWDSIWNAINLGLILLDDKGQVKMWNDWIARHSGIPADFATDQPLEALFPDGLNAAFRTALKNALTHKLPIVLSNALHRSPLPLYPLPVTAKTQARIQQSITITPVAAPNGGHLCLIQVTDASMSVKRERVLKLQSDKLSIDATTDSLTGAYNRRYFDERYKSEFGRAQRQGTAFGLLMLDIDYFKDYNDNYGHPAGDRALISVVNAIKQQLNRATDLLMRYGGEEFAVLLPDCDEQGARSVAERLRAAVIDLNIPHQKSRVADYLTLSIGSASVPAGVRCDPACLLQTADNALYEAKRSGRNCVRHHPTPDCGKPGSTDTEAA